MGFALCRRPPGFWILDQGELMSLSIILEVHLGPPSQGGKVASQAEGTWSREDKSDFQPKEARCPARLKECGLGKVNFTFSPYLYQCSRSHCSTVIQL